MIFFFVHVGIGLLGSFFAKNESIFRFYFRSFSCKFSNLPLVVKKYTAYDRFHGNGPYGKIPTKKGPIRTCGFTLTLLCHIIMYFTSHLFFKEVSVLKNIN